MLKEIFDSVSTTSVHIKDVCLDIKVGIVIKPTQYYVSENGVPAFRNANVRRGYINDTDWVMISKEGHQQNCRSEVHTNDVLISRSGANLGMASVVPARYNGYNAIDVVIAVPDISKVIPEFLAQYTNSPMGRAIVTRCRTRSPKCICLCKSSYWCTGFAGARKIGKTNIGQAFSLR